MAETERTTGQMAAGLDSRSNPGEPLRPDRPWDHLGDVLKFVITAVLALAAAGCSARVETESENWGASPASISPEWQVSTGEKARTAVEVDLLQTRPSEPSPPKPTSSANTVILNLGDGDIHVHEPQFLRRTGPPEEEHPQHENRLAKHLLAARPLGLPGLSSRLGARGNRRGVDGGDGWCKDGGPLLSTIGLLVAAAVILQALPPTESGLQFIPLSPWAYSGLVPICLSILCWAGLLLAALIVMLSSGLIGAPSGFSAAVLFSMGCSLLLSLGGGSARAEVASVVNRGPVSSESAGCDG